MIYCNAGSQFYFTCFLLYKSQTTAFFLANKPTHCTHREHTATTSIHVDEPWSCRHETRVFRWMALTESFTNQYVVTLYCHIGGPTTSNQCAPSKIFELSQVEPSAAEKKLCSVSRGIFRDHERGPPAQPVHKASFPGIKDSGTHRSIELVWISMCTLDCTMMRNGLALVDQEFLEWYGRSQHFRFDRGDHFFTTSQMRF